MISNLNYKHYYNHMAMDDMTDTINKQQVLKFLRDNPDFLANNVDELDELTPPAKHDGAGVVDFQQYMVKRLRGKNENIRRQQQELLELSRENMNIQNRVHAVVISLLEAGSFEEFIDVVLNDLGILLDIDVVAVVLEAKAKDIPHGKRSGIRLVEPGRINDIMGDSHIRLERDCGGRTDIYGSMAGVVNSQALIRLFISSRSPAGLLALGSRDRDMFAPGRGTDLISFLSGVIERLIRLWLDLPPAKVSQA